MNQNLKTVVWDNIYIGDGQVFHSWNEAADYLFKALAEEIKRGDRLIWRGGPGIESRHNFARDVTEYAVFARFARCPRTESKANKEEMRYLPLPPVRWLKE